MKPFVILYGFQLMFSNQLHHLLTNSFPLFRSIYNRNFLLKIDLIKRSSPTNSFSNRSQNSLFLNRHDSSKGSKLLQSLLPTANVTTEVRKNKNEQFQNNYYPHLVFVKNTQRSHPIDKEMVRNITATILSVMGLPEYRVDIWFCSDAKIRSLNAEWRYVNKSTDVLSFPLYDFVSPGVFKKNQLIEPEKHLGDIVISPSYVMRQIQRDKNDFEHIKTDIDQEGPDDETDAGVEYDAGVSLVMASGAFTLEERIPLLIIHSLLHLIGYDHETDEDWKIMTVKEQEIMETLKTIV